MSAEPEVTRLRIEKVIVDGLFGRYDHKVSLSLDERITVLHGPNGVGKTMLLSWIEALFRLDLRAFAPVPFRRFAVRLSHGVTLSLWRRERARPWLPWDMDAEFIKAVD